MASKAFKNGENIIQRIQHKHKNGVFEAMGVDVNPGILKLKMNRAFEPKKLGKKKWPSSKERLDTKLKNYYMKMNVVQPKTNLK